MGNAIDAGTESQFANGEEAAMTQPQREELFAILMEGIASAEEVGEEVHREMVDLTTGDLDRMEPVINRMLNEAFQAGRNFADRKTEADIVNPRETVIVL